MISLQSATNFAKRGGSGRLVRGRQVEKYDIQAQKVLPSNAFKILLVHVGKTAGQTIAAMLTEKHISFQQLHVRALDSIMIDSLDTITMTDFYFLFFSSTDTWLRCTHKETRGCDLIIRYCATKAI